MNFTTKSKSHCGPLLFLIMTYDLPSCVQGSDVVNLQYADDTKFMSPIRNDKDRHDMQFSIDNLVEWSAINRLNLNASKTYHVSYYIKRNIPIQTTYYIRSVEIEKKQTIKDLGITFDSKLKFNEHINNVQKRITNMNCLSWRFTKEIRSAHLMRRLHNSFILPIAEYGSCVWANKTGPSINRLEKVQRNLTRTILHSSYRSGLPNYRTYTNRLMELSMLSLESRRHLAAIMFIVKLLKGTIRSSLAEQLTNYRLIRSRATRNTNTFDLGKIKPKASPLYFACDLYNKYQHMIQINNTELSIKIALFSGLIAAYVR